MSIFIAIVIIVVILLYIAKLQKEIRKRKIAEQRLDTLNKTLEKKVKDATKELEDRNNELKESLENFQILIDTAMEAIILSNDGKIVNANKRAAEIFGFKNKDEIFGKNMLEFVEESKLKTVQVALQNSIANPYELTLKRLDGTPIYVIAAGKNIKIKGKFFRISTIIDITKLKEKEVLLQRQSRLAAMGEMIGAIAHQWRQPLNALAINIQNLDDDYEDGLIDEKFLEEFIDNNMKIINFMSKTIDDFRNFFATGKEKAIFNVQDGIKEIVNMQSAQFGNYNIKAEITGVSFEVKGCENEFKQVILNIINNAKDAIVENKIKNGKIEVKLDGKNKRISILDNGGGIPDNIKDRIFEPYFTTKEPGRGTGIGLYMSKMIVEENMHGKIDVLNIDGGAMFVLEF
jgi:PAS domain S-box-containing protein